MKQKENPFKKLENEQKIFKWEDDKKEIHVKDKFSDNKSTKRSAYEKHENSNLIVPVDKIDKESRRRYMNQQKKVFIIIGIFITLHQFCCVFLQSTHQVDMKNIVEC